MNNRFTNQRMRIAVVACAVGTICGVVGMPAVAQERQNEMLQRIREQDARIAQLERINAELAMRTEGQRHYFINVIEHLEHAMMILNEHGNGELAMQIDHVANQVRERVQRAEREARPERPAGGEEEHPERRAAREQINIIESALQVLREAERGDAIHLAELAIMARRMGLEGRRDEEAKHIRQQQPNREQLLRIFGMAVELYQEFGAAERAEELARAVREFWPNRERDREQPAARERGGGEREMVAHQLEIMRIALPALLEAGRADTAELLERAMIARELLLEGARGEEARHMIESAPSMGQVIEILAFASRLWNEFGHEGKARQVGELAEQMGAAFRQRQERNERERPREGGDREARMHELEAHAEELMRALEEVRAELNRMREGRR